MTGPELLFKSISVLSASLDDCAVARRSAASAIDPARDAREKVFGLRHVECSSIHLRAKASARAADGALPLHTIVSLSAMIAFMS
jgi:hypothetical protein